MSEFDKIRQDVKDFNTRIKSWDLDQLSEEEADEIAEMVEEMMALLAGEGEGDDIEEDDEDFE